MSLPSPDHRFLAAEGWLELGNIQECYNELEEISPMYKTHRSVLELRVKMYSKAEKWDHVEAISETLAELIPDSPFGAYTYCRSLRMQRRHECAVRPLKTACGKFPNEWRLSYDLACCLCQTKDLKGALEWLEKTFDISGKLVECPHSLVQLL